MDREANSKRITQHHRLHSSQKEFAEPSLSRLVEIRDSIGKVFIPGRLPKSHMITEKAYRPYFYRTKLAEKKAFLTKGMWEVKRDFMAGPFVNYIVEDENRWLVLEEFCFCSLGVQTRLYV